MAFFKNKVLMSVLLVSFFLIASYFIVSFVSFLYIPASSVEKELILDIPSGSNFRSVTKLLAEKKLIKNEKKFRIFARIMGSDSKIKAGELRFYTNMSPIQILDTLVNGKPVLYTFTVPEGYNIYQIADILVGVGLIKSPKEFIEATKDKVLLVELGIPSETVEGFLFPDTYSVSRVTDTKQIIRVMHKKFRELVTPELIQKAKRNGFSEKEFITLASIIEKETGAPWERRIISSVFHNRLKKGMRLQSDPTTIYGIWQSHTGNLTRKELETYTPYNTYKIFGLPKGPIANPGMDAILSVLEPEKTNYLFFVSKNDGTHYFSEDYSGHKKAVNDYQKNSANRVGKSWRDLNKNN